MEISTSPAPVSEEPTDNKIKSDDQPAAESTPPTKKKRNLPGMPDPDSEVIALSPKALLATNRFVCEICNKGFQRDQNLQLHRRGHNLPWKLRQRTTKEIKKRVYVCPEATCIHHHPSRALGDLTGIKKHFCRKHGEKKYKCERCSKKYAVQSDWKAHMKTCGTREYLCDCGTLFNRRDSFITHRAFCDALAQESARPQPPAAITSSGGDLKVQVVVAPPQPPPASASSPPPPPLTPSTGVVSPVLSIQSSAELPENQTPTAPPLPPPPSPLTTTTAAAATISSTTNSHIIPSSKILTSIFNNPPTSTPQQESSSYSSLLCAMAAGPDRHIIDPFSLSLSSSLYGPSSLLQTPPQHYPSSSPQPALSATALLQKAAQMGATSTSSSFLHGLGLTGSLQPDPQENNPSTSSNPTTHWSDTGSVKIESNSFRLGLGLPTSGPSGFNELMMSGPSTMFANKPTTLDLLGLGMGTGESPSGGFSAFLSSIGGGIDMGNGEWDDQCERKPSML